MAHVARAQKLTTGPFNIAASVSIGPVAGVFGLAVELVATFPELPREIVKPHSRLATQLAAAPLTS